MMARIIHTALESPNSISTSLAVKCTAQKIFALTDLLAEGLKTRIDP